MAGWTRSRPALVALLFVALVAGQMLGSLPIRVRAADPTPQPSASPLAEPSPDAPGAVLVGEATIVAYQSAGYKFQVVGHGGGTGFEAPGFDDSAWAAGEAARN